MGFGFRRRRGYRRPFSRKYRRKVDMWTFRDLRNALNVTQFANGHSPTDVEPWIAAYRLVGPKDFHAVGNVVASPTKKGLRIGRGRLSLQYKINTELAATGTQNVTDIVQVLSVLTVLQEGFEGDGTGNTGLVYPLDPKWPRFSAFPEIPGGGPTYIPDAYRLDCKYRCIWHRLDALPFIGKNRAGATPRDHISMSGLGLPTKTNSVSLKEDEGLYLISYVWSGMVLDVDGFMLEQDTFFHFPVSEW